MTATKQPSPSDLELFKIYQRAYLERSKQGDPDHTRVSQCCHAACRALFEAGREAGRAELEQVILAGRIDELESIRRSGVVHPLDEMIRSRIEQLRAAMKRARWGDDK